MKQEMLCLYQGDYIQLNQLLKREKLVQSGAEAKGLIANGQVLVNGQREEAVRRKLREGDVVEWKDVRLILQKES